MPKVTTIPATISTFAFTPQNKTQRRKVAGYARVSTAMEEQTNSYQAQVDYYTNYIKSKTEWEFVNVYTDEGITGTSTANREGFKTMIDDAIKGNIDLIITKSVSRFARNTVDSLVTIRKLKEHKVEVYFEKENIWTFDGKGELLLTIMSSLAQEESRSISENVTWGKRKGFQDGKVEMPYSRFLGFKKGEDGKPEVIEEEANVVRLIYNRFISGYGSGAIAKELMKLNIKSPSGKEKWYANTIESILKNEKYAGDALLQKTYSTSFLTKKRVKNNGEIPQYYVEDSHPSIISKELFTLVQDEMKRRKEEAITMGSELFAGKIFCGNCGSVFGSKVWHSTDKYRCIIWQCNAKYSTTKKCTTKHVKEQQLEQAFIQAVCKLLKNKTEIIAELNLIIEKCLDTKILEDELLSTNNEIEVVRNLVKKLYENCAYTPIEEKKVNELEIKYKALENKILELNLKIEDKKERGQKIKVFIKSLAKTANEITEFDKGLFEALAEKMIVQNNNTITVVFKDGTEIACPTTSK